MRPAVAVVVPVPRVLVRVPIRMQNVYCSVTAANWARPGDARTVAMAEALWAMAVG